MLEHVKKSVLEHLPLSQLIHSVAGLIYMSEEEITQVRPQQVEIGAHEVNKTAHDRFMCTSTH